MFMFCGIFNLAYGDTRRVIYHVAPGVWLASTWDRAYGDWTPPAAIPAGVGMRLILRDRRRR